MNLPTRNGHIRIYNANLYGNVLNPMAITTYSAFSNTAYWAAVRFLSQNLASFPHTTRQNGVVEDLKHPLDKLLDLRPNNYQTPFNLLQAWYLQAAHNGNGYLRVERDDSFRPVALHNLCCLEVCPFRLYLEDKATKKQITQQLYYNLADGKIYPGADILHIRTMTYDGERGLDLIHLHTETLEQASLHTRFTTRYLSKGTVIRGSIEMPDTASEETVAQIKKDLSSYMRGPEADEDVLVITGGGKLNNATINPEQSQLTQQGVGITKKICQVIGVPPQFIYEFSEAKYNDAIEAMGQHVVRYTFRTWIEQVEDELTMKLLSEGEQDLGLRVHIDPGVLTRGDTAAITEEAVTTVNAGLRSRNAGRALLGLAPDKDPESDKLKALGDTGGQPTPPEKTNTPAPAKAPTNNGYSALRPIIDSLCDRIDTKTEKAFTNHSKKPDQERTIWCNVFSDQQAKDVIEILQPISESLQALGSPALDLEKISQRYATAIRKRGSTGEVTTLRTILGEI